MGTDHDSFCIVRDRALLECGVVKNVGRSYPVLAMACPGETAIYSLASSTELTRLRRSARAYYLHFLQIRREDG